MEGNYEREPCECKICLHCDTQYPVIGLIGGRGSGKTTCANYLNTHYNFQEFSFADPVKKIVEIVYGFDYETLKGDTPEKREKRVSTRDPVWDKNMIQAMQFIGTELFRDHMDQDVWIKIMKRNIENLVKNNKRVVISDLRYPNEIEFVRSIGGSVWVLKRESNVATTQSDVVVTKSVVATTDTHSSETSYFSAIKDTDPVVFNDFKQNYFENIKKTLESVSSKNTFVL